MMSMCRVFSCVVGRGCLLWPLQSLGKTLLAFDLLHSVLPRWSHSPHLDTSICLWCLNLEYQPSWHLHGVPGSKIYASYLLFSQHHHVKETIDMEIVEAYSSDPSVAWCGIKGNCFPALIITRDIYIQLE